MNSVSDLRVCGSSVLLVRLPGGWGAFILEERRQGVKGEDLQVHRTEVQSTAFTLGLLLCQSGGV